MPSTRALSGDLTRLLAAVAAPVLALDEARQIVYANGAACRWLGIERDLLVGQTVAYHSSPAATPLEAKLAGLCPPAEVFGGSQSTMIVRPVAENGQSASRKVQFIPLPDDQGDWALVLAIVDPRDTTTDDVASLDGAVTESAKLHSRLLELHRQARASWQMDRLLGDSPAMTMARTQVALAIGSSANVLVVGPPGSGRPHVARAIHYGAPLSEPGGLIPLSCSLLGPELLSSALAALPPRDSGVQHDGGPRRQAETLLLTDVDEMPAEVQTELAARLERNPPRHRVVATAKDSLDNLNSTAMAAADRFRPDLAAALSTIVIRMPPLASRRQDIPLLAQMFVEELNAKGEKQLSGLTPESLDQLATYPWPGNIDELGAMIREAHATAEGAYIAPADLPKRIYLSTAAQLRRRRAVEPIELDKVLGQIEIELIGRALRLAKGNKTKAAKLLGLTRPRLYRRMVQLGLEKPL